MELKKLTLSIALIYLSVSLTAVLITWYVFRIDIFDSWVFGSLTGLMLLYYHNRKNKYHNNKPHQL